MAIFKKYTEAGRRAIYFTQQTAIRSGVTTIDTQHLFLGLLSEARTRADQIFQFKDHVPD